ncbi:MAG: hypothetical protein KGH72_02145 [Candidatus Micrarchaeota archaeon]|nr:hypothetical protein [Candidatus Micrarchaeota archaeon]
MKQLRLQSAMEYLMTYGWAILIIAIVMVALYFLGILGGNNVSTACLAQPGYICGNPAFSSVTGNLIVTVGQNTGVNWASANVIFVPNGELTYGILTPSYFTAANTGIAFNAIGMFATGQEATIILPINGMVTSKPYYPVGSSIAGVLWFEYTQAPPAGNGQNLFVEIGAVNLKAS